MINLGHKIPLPCQSSQTIPAGKTPAPNPGNNTNKSSICWVTSLKSVTTSAHSKIQINKRMSRLSKQKWRAHFRPVSLKTNLRESASWVTTFFSVRIVRNPLQCLKESPKDLIPPSPEAQMVRSSHLTAQRSLKTSLLDSVMSATISSSWSQKFWLLQTINDFWSPTSAKVCPDSTISLRSLFPALLGQIRPSCSFSWTTSRQRNSPKACWWTSWPLQKISHHPAKKWCSSSQEEVRKKSRTTTRPTNILSPLSAPRDCQSRKSPKSVSKITLLRF